MVHRVVSLRSYRVPTRKLLKQLRLFFDASEYVDDSRMSLQDTLRNRLRGNRNWVAFRRLQHEGWVQAYRRWSLWSKILGTPPVETETVHQHGPVEVHLLCHERDYLQAIWALKSFYRYSDVTYPLVIHVQGRAYGRMATRLQRHFPAARIVLQHEADAVVEEWLSRRGLLRLLSARRTSPYMLKLTDFLLMSRAVHLLTIDSDVLFFRCPTDLLAASEKPLSVNLFQRDPANNYNLSREQALADLGIALAPRINVGLMLFARESIDLFRCEEYLAHPDVAGSGPFLDQTLYALCASEQGKVAYLPDNYLVSLDDRVNLQHVIARHYAGPSRPALTSEGIPALIQSGFLEDLYISRR